MATLKDFVEGIAPIANAAQQLLNNPYVKQQLEAEQIQQYWDEIQQYESNRFNLTDDDIELLLITIHSGKNTFKDLQDTLPELNSPTVSYYLIDDQEYRYERPLSIEDLHPVPRTYLFLLQQIPDDFIAPYEFKPTDTFDLSVSAQNRLSKILKANHLADITEESLLISKQSLDISKHSAKSSKYAFYAAIASIAVSVILFLIQLYLAK